MTEQITQTIVNGTSTNTSAGGREAFGTTGPMLSDTFQIDAPKVTHVVEGGEEYDNPMHHEDFTVLLNAAAKSRK